MSTAAGAEKPPAILLLGPSASGKTDLAIELARRFPVALISVDSAQVFREMNIGTAKPSPATLASFPHHLIDLISPEEAYSAARFRSDALRSMAAICAGERIPLLVGGTMLYFQSLLSGLNDLPTADPAIRAELDERAARLGWPTLHAELARLDPVTAARLPTTDSQRIQRALEVYRLTGQPLATLLSASKPAPPPYRFLCLGLAPSERAALHRRIAARFDAMLAAGLEAEVEHLRSKYRLHADLPSMRCVGYRQVWEVQCGVAPARELRERGVIATRQLAKRQLTWMSNTLRPQILDCLDADLRAQACARVSRFLGA